jgi:hypothetical protein
VFKEILLVNCLDTSQRSNSLTYFSTHDRGSQNDVVFGGVHT